MLPLSYYFRNSYKKNWYARGKLSKTEYKQWVENTNVFVSNLVENVLESQKKTVDSAIWIFESQKNASKSALHEIMENKTKQINAIQEKMNQDNDILKTEQEKIKTNFEKESLIDSKKISYWKDLINQLLKRLDTVSEETNKTINDQSNRLKDKRNDCLKQNISLIKQEVKQFFSNVLNTENNSSSTWKVDKKSMWFLFLLLVCCFFDVYLGYKMILDISSNDVIFSISIALLIVPIAIILVHFSVEAQKQWWIYKTIWNLSVYFIIFLLIAYVMYSKNTEFMKLLKNFSFGKLGEIFLSDVELILRSFIIPSLFVWEMLIDKINWDVVLNNLWFWKISFWKKISTLITKILFFLKNHKISKYAKEEQKEFNKIIEEMKSETIPSVIEIKKDLNNINSIFNPIVILQEQKISEYNEHMKKLQEKIDENTLLANQAITNIHNRYSADISKYETTIKNIDIKINKLKQDYNQALVSAKEWILIGLIDD